VLFGCLCIPGSAAPAGLAQHFDVVQWCSGASIGGIWGVVQWGTGTAISLSIHCHNFCLFFVLLRNFFGLPLSVSLHFRRPFSSAVFNYQGQMCVELDLFAFHCRDSCLACSWSHFDRISCRCRYFCPCSSTFVYTRPILNLDLCVCSPGPPEKSHHKIRCFSALQMLIRIQIGVRCSQLRTLIYLPGQANSVSGHKKCKKWPGEFDSTAISAMIWAACPKNCPPFGGGTRKNAPSLQYSVCRSHIPQPISQVCSIHRQNVWENLQKNPS